MQKSLLHIVMVSTIMLAGCAGITVREDLGPIPSDRIRQLNRIMNTTDVSEADNLLNDIESSWRYSGDPVLKTMRGNIEMLKGEHWYAGVKFREAIQLIHDGSLYTSSGSYIEEFKVPDRRTNSGQLKLREDAEIIREFYHYLHERRNHSQVLEKFRNRSGFIPHPPIFSNSGTPGLILEIINEHVDEDIFRPRNIQYLNHASKSNMLSIIGLNLLTVSILDEDLDGIEEAIELLAIEYRKDARLQTQEGRYIFGVGLYLIGDDIFRNYFDFRHRHLFIR